MNDPKINKFIKKATEKNTPADLDMLIFFE